MKICTKCGMGKDISEFVKDKNTKDGHSGQCKKCNKEYREKSSIKIKKFQKNWRKDNKEKLIEDRKQRKKKFPWKMTLYRIRSRCNSKSSPDYKYYGGRGIECKITEDELKYLWNRDKAWSLKKPSIDREDNDGNYTLENCRYIELSKNVAERNKEHTKTILQYSKNGKFIKEFKSITNASKELNCNICTISLVLRGKNKTAKGFIWRYKK